MHDIEVHDGSSFRPFFATKHMVAILLTTQHTITPGECHSRSPVLRNKPYDARYYENYVYYVPQAAVDPDRVHAIRNWNEQEAETRRRQRHVKKRGGWKWWNFFKRKKKPKSK